jgi:hypothetical protein
MEAIQDKALIVGIFVPSELVNCSIVTMFQIFEGNIGDASCRVLVMHQRQQRVVNVNQRTRMKEQKET